MNNKDLKERLLMIINHLNRISVTGTENAENLVIAAKLVLDLYKNIKEEVADNGDLTETAERE